jgi:pSer/pThr/pTyr-binding forkhead associated (FHA) protein
MSGLNRDAIPVDGQSSPFRLKLYTDEIRLAYGSTTIGRSEDCQITLFDPLVSRHHALIIINVDGAFIDDLRSRNGVMVNEVRVHARTRIENGSRIRLGRQNIIVSEKQVSETGEAARTGTAPPPQSVGPLSGHTSTTLTEADGHDWEIVMLSELYARMVGAGRDVDATKILEAIIAKLESATSALTLTHDTARELVQSTTTLRKRCDVGSMEFKLAEFLLKHGVPLKILEGCAA